MIKHRDKPFGECLQYNSVSLHEPIFILATDNKKGTCVFPHSLTLPKMAPATWINIRGAEKGNTSGHHMSVLTKKPIGC